MTHNPTHIHTTGITCPTRTFFHAQVTLFKFSFSLILPGVILALMLHLSACSQPSDERNPVVYNGQLKGPLLHASEIKSVLINDDHNSEGFLAPLKNGDIMLLFRLDPGMAGHHVGMDAYIARTTYNPHKNSWSEVKPVYNSHRYDDRNIHGGVTRDGRIVLFFRHYGFNDDGRYTEGKYYLLSDDQGKSWSGPHRSPAWSDPADPDPRFGIWGTGQMFFNPETDRYTMLGYGRHYTAVTYSPDGSGWDEWNLVREDPDVALTEIAGAWAGGSRLIALIRDDERKAGHPLLQVESHDNGKSWSEPRASNIPPDNLWGGAPQLIYDAKRDLLIALTSDRYVRDHKDNGLFVYSARPDEVFGNPENWTLEMEIPRPWASPDYETLRPMDRSLYGYPTIAPVSENEYLVVFTERTRMEGTEQADLYYFRLKFNGP